MAPHASTADWTMRGSRARGTGGRWAREQHQHVGRVVAQPAHPANGHYVEPSNNRLEARAKIAQVEVVVEVVPGFPSERAPYTIAWRMTMSPSATRSQCASRAIARGGCSTGGLHVAGWRRSRAALSPPCRSVGRDQEVPSGQGHTGQRNRLEDQESPIPSAFAKKVSIIAWRPTLRGDRSRSLTQPDHIHAARERRASGEQDPIVLRDPALPAHGLARAARSRPAPRCARPPASPGRTSPSSPARGVRRRAVDAQARRNHGLHRSSRRVDQEHAIARVLPVRHGRVDHPHHCRGAGRRRRRHGPR